MKGVARFDSNQLTITSTDQSLPQAFSSTMQFTQNGATETFASAGGNVISRRIFTRVE